MNPESLIDEAITRFETKHAEILDRIYEDMMDNPPKFRSYLLDLDNNLQHGIESYTDLNEIGAVLEHYGYTVHDQRGSIQHISSIFVEVKR